ncbi:MAG: ABC transporter ATP-binding protein [Firmicutes bacterium HGW-Firmicutes-7]|nr:MAG: ABC transporter ATP-binding protein [Firmicutes bacterium HGW-Firmicutes-7]
MTKKILEMKNIIKEFPGVRALDNVNFNVNEHEIHALVGENGAGKSTLMGVLSGVHKYDSYSGDIIYDGEICKFKTTKDSEKKGIAIIHQELALVPYLSIAENVFLGNECKTTGIINWHDTHRRTTEVLNKVGLNIDTKTLVKDIGVGKQQLVEIAKALSKEVKLLILDEPTAALNDEEAEKLLDLLLNLKKEGVTSIIITHKLNEVMKVADEVTIIRDGATIETLVKSKDIISEDRIVKGMVGRELVDRYPKREKTIGDLVFEVKNWTVHHPLDTSRIVLDNINLKVQKGEIVGIAGLMGAGRTELAKSIFGKCYGSKITGELIKEGKRLEINNVSQAIKQGFAYITEDRKDEGLVLIHDIMTNLTLSNLERISKMNVIDKHLEVHECEQMLKKFNIKATTIMQKTGKLSGGNQQKVAIGKWLFTNPDILLMDEPTRGIDVGAKYEIYTIINELANQGKYIIIISSEINELLGICDRIYVLNEGRIVGEVEGIEATQEGIMKKIIRNNKEADLC